MTSGCTGVIPCTITAFEALPPAPVHARLKVIAAATPGLTDRVPDTATDPDQSPWLGFDDAVHAVTFVADHVSVTVCPTTTELAEAKIVTEGGGGGSCVPPPHP
jgi:hypothetical protein